MQKYQTHKRMCLASKPRANVFRQKSFKASVQREHRIQVSDQHIYFQRCLHLHEQDIYIKNKRKQKKNIYLSCMWNHMESMCHLMFHLSNTQNLKENSGFRSKHAQVTDHKMKEYAYNFCFTGKCP